MHWPTEATASVERSPGTLQQNTQVQKPMTQRSSMRPVGGSWMMSVHPCERKPGALIHNDLSRRQMEVRSSVLVTLCSAALGTQEGRDDLGARATSSQV